MTHVQTNERSTDDLITAIALSRRTMPSRLVSSVFGVLAMGPFVGFIPGVIWFAVVATYVVVMQFVTSPLLVDLHARKPRRAEWMMTASNAVASALYTCAPVYAWTFGGAVGQVFAICWLIGTIIHAFHLFADRPSSLWTVCSAPALALAVLPFLQFGVSFAAFAMIAIFVQFLRVSIIVSVDLDRTRRDRDAHDRARRAAEAANAAKSQFLATVSHELRTPLNAIIGYSEILSEDLEAGEAPTPDDAVRIQAAARHLLALISDVLDMSKIEAGKMELAPEPIDVANFVEDVAATVRTLAAANGNSLTLVAAPGLGEAVVDATKLRQCLLNLASNACKFTRNGEIVIAARREIDPDGDRLAFTVSDTGIGIPPEQAARLFQPFTQLDSSHRRRFGGTGLGLAITRDLARLMGGDVELAPSHGRGAVFHLWARVQAHAEAPPGAAAIAA